jgi:hypothetical protein
MNLSNNFFWKCLSENGEPSSKRVLAAATVITVLYIAIYTAHVGKIFDHYVLTTLIVFASVLLGLATTAQIIGAIGTLKGNNPPPAPTDEPKKD